MIQLSATVTCPIHNSFRVQQVAGMFDVPLAEKAEASFQAEWPEPTEPWQIGLIVGPSGSGKTTIARQAFGPRLYTGGDWPRDRAVVDCLGDLSIRQVTGLFTMVGFSSPPSWVKPYHVLSGGERFRCDLARALAESVVGGQWTVNSLESPPGTDSPTTDHRPPATAAGATAALPLVVFDEFTSVVDRNVARIGSAAMAKGIREGRVDCRFVAVTCHYDVAEWLAPDWVVDMANGAVPAEASSATGDRAGNLSLPAPCLAPVCASSLFERLAQRAGPLLSGLVARHAGRLLRDVARDRPARPLADQPHRHAARLSRHRHRHARGRGRGRAAPRRRGPRQRHGQPSGAVGALPTLAPLAAGARAQDGLGQRAAIQGQLSILGRPGRGVVRVSGRAQ